MGLLLVPLSFPAYNYSHINVTSLLLGENSTILAEGYDVKVSMIQNDFNVELNFVMILSYLTKSRMCLL